MREKKPVRLPSHPPAWYLDLGGREPYPPPGQPLEVRWRSFEGSSWGLIGARVSSVLSLRVLESETGYWGWADYYDGTRDDGLTYASVEAAQLGAVRFAVGEVEADLAGLTERLGLGEADPPEDPRETEELELQRRDRGHLEALLKVL